MSNNCILSFLGDQTPYMPPSQWNEPTLSQMLYLMHMDGVPGDTPVAEEMGHVMTRSITTSVLDSAQSVFGGVSMKNTNGYVGRNMTAGETIGTRDFTLECWVRPTSLGNFINGLFQISNGYTLSSGFMLYVLTTGQIVYYVGNGRRITTANNTIRVNQWHHVALTRASGTVSLWVNGVLVGQYTDPASKTDTAFRLGNTIGNESGSTAGSFIGNIDEFRAVVGLAVYYQNFTPPSAPFVVPAA